MFVRSKLIALLSTSFPCRSFTVLRFARYSRQPFSDIFSAAVFRGHLPSISTRPNIGFWVGEANRFYSESTINEGCVEEVTTSPSSKISHPWPEWHKLADLLIQKGYSDRCITSGDDDDSLSGVEDLPEEFVKAAKACLGFARDRPDILRLLTKKNIEAVVQNGSPFLFNNGENSIRRVKFFLTGEKSNELEVESAQTVDIMRYLLSYVYGPLCSSDDDNLKSNEPVENSVRKLLCELFNLSGTVWKPKSVDATSVELPMSNRHSPQHIETTDGDQMHPNIPGRSTPAPENQLSSFGNPADQECEKNIISQKQDQEIIPSSQAGGLSTSNGSFTNVFDNNLESWRAQTNTTINRGPSNETTIPAYVPKNSIHPGNGYNAYYGGYNTKPIQPSDVSSANRITNFDASSANSSSPPSIQRNDYRHTSYNGYNANSSHTSYNGYNANSTQPLVDSWSRSASFSGGQFAHSSPSSASDRYNLNSTTPSYGGSGMNSSQSPDGSWSNHNTSYGGHTANSTQHSSNSWSSGNGSYGEFSPNSSLPPNKPTTQFDGYNSQSNQAYNTSWNNTNASHAGFGSNSPHPPTNSWNAYDTSQSGFTERLTQPPANSWNSRNTSYNASNNPWSNNNRSFGGPTITPLNNSRNNPNTNTTNSTEPFMSTRNNDNTYAGLGPVSNCEYPANLNQQSGYSWSSKRENCSSGLPTQAQAQNARMNGNNGYSGKSLEGSCVTEPDPLDMSEEAKAERWFRRAAQIKDISELSQIPDEDFPQIMPMRKGVNRFVVSKRKTPLERRLASQQYKKSLPVVSSEPERDPTTAGDNEN